MADDDAVMSSQGDLPSVDHMGRRVWQPRPERKVRESEVRYDFEEYEGPESRIGWVLNMLPTTIRVGDNIAYEVSALELYLLTQDGLNQFRVAIAYEPYFYIAAALQHESKTAEICGTLIRRFAQIEGMRADLVLLEDLDTPNHVAGRKRNYIKLSFRTVNELMQVRKELAPIITSNKPRLEAAANRQANINERPDDLIQCLDEMREYDVPYYMRAAIDLDIRVGAWVEVRPASAPTEDTPIPEASPVAKTEDEAEGKVAEASIASRFTAIWRRDILEKPSPRVLAFDIECTKAALKFPNAEHDEVFMISYMVDGEGFLIISRTVVSEDISDLEYTPKPKFPGKFKVFNEIDEKALLKRFIQHCRELKPHIYVTYNGDFFDWPFVKRRCQIHDLDIEHALGIACDERSDGATSGEFRGFAGPVHLDAFYWVKRDSYLPQGSQGLKAVTKCKLGYDPVEVDAEDMVRFAGDDPQTMAEYSVSDAVSTYYLYGVYVNLFIFSLCTVIPNGSEDVLRKGSGTLCESLLMVQAYKANVVTPNKQNEPLIRRHEGRVLESETYVGGHVECLDTGVFRSDLDYSFDMDPAALMTLADKVERDVRFAVEVEAGAKVSECENFDEVCAAIRSKLDALRAKPNRMEKPFIYHLDVGAMYPNIILTNRLQPTAIVSREDCAACDYNDGSREGGCKRPMEWIWRGEVNPASAAEVNQLRRQLQYEIVDGQSYHELPEKERAHRLKTRLKDYSQKVYKKTRIIKQEPRVDVVCMRENSFYVDTVRAFRDRRYEYKALVKKWKKQKATAESRGDDAERKQAEDKEELFDSLQLAHKCILNSFYGYVMRKGARWRSMPMAGIVTLTGANLITQARELVEKLGRPLELDTDGIWCMLPASFPENYELLLKREDGSTKKVALSYPCAMLNADVHENYSNHQYQTLVKSRDESTQRDTSYYATSSECSIFFEVDGPYRCMVIPASTEEGRLLKKRYAVFNHDGSLAELKGFELKRRGELSLIKTFQSEIFEQFLQGESLEACYDSVANVANQWLDVLDTRGAGLEEEDLLDLISENRAMSREVEQYEGRKMTSLTTARRLADFLGDEMLADKGLQCKLVIASRPRGAPVTDRAIPTAIFAAEPAVKRHYLRKWLRDPNLEGDVREVLDWNYYRERLDGVVRKIITIPAALQRVVNPVPRVAHPDWLKRIVAQRDDTKKQTKIFDHFQKSKRVKKVLVSDSNANKRRISSGGDLEDIGSPHSVKGLVTTARVTQPKNLKPQGPPPQMHDDFGAWLEDRKRRWRARRQQARANVVSTVTGRNNKVEDLGAVPTLGRKRALGVTDMVRQTNDALNKGVWRVLELRPSETAGEMHCWVLTELGHLQRVVVTVPRLMYLEIRGDDAEAAAAVRAVGGRRAPHWKAPKPSLHKGNVLYELRLPERRYAENSRALATFLAHPGLDAAYELATPLWFRSLLVLGQFARVQPSGAVTNQHGDFDLDELNLVCEHEASSDMVRHVFLYHARCARTGRAIVALFFFHRSNSAQDDDGGQRQQEKKSSHKPVAVIAMADPRAKRGEKAPPLKRLYDMVVRPEEMEKKTGRLKRLWVGASDDEDEESENEEEEEEAHTANGWSALKILRSEVVKDESSAFALASSALAEYASERRGASMVVVQSPTPAKLLRRSVPVLSDFPNVEMAFHEADSDFPALGWRSAMAKRSFERLRACPAWLEARFATARFGNVPICNLGDDPLVLVADVAFARLLRNNRHLLWASESPQPDLGSGGDDASGGVFSSIGDETALPDNLLEDDHAKAAPTSGSVGRHSRSDLLAPKHADDALDASGAYRCACVRLDVFGAAVNAVMVADALDEEDDCGGAPASADFGDTLGGGCREAFYLLKNLVNDWLDDVKSHNSSHADALLVAFYRWLSARSSLLHFPELRNLVLGLMRRVHSKLIAELRRLGMRVVHADFHELVLATDKNDPRHALEHLRFVASTLSARPIFAYLSLEPTAWYASLLWIDPHNFAAIEPLDPPKDEEDEPITSQNVSQRRVMALDDDDEEDDEDDQGQKTSAEEEEERRVAKSEDKFVSNWKLGGGLPELAREYLDVLVGSFMHKPLQCARQRARERASQHDSSRLAIAAVSKEDEYEDQLAVVDTAMRVVQEYIADKLMELISELQRREDYYTDTSAPLTFVKLVTHLLSLDPNVEEEVRKIRRLGLAKVGVLEFAPEAAFTLPTTAVVVKDVNCTFCNACADLDLSDPNCRVPLSSEKNSSSVAISCAKCSSHYDLLDLELRVAEQLHHLSSSLVSSDLRCNKCHRVATSNMATLCSCSGEYAVDVPHQKISAYIDACATVAKDLNMPYLSELASRLQS